MKSKQYNSQITVTAIDNLVLVTSTSDGVILANITMTKDNARELARVIKRAVKASGTQEVL
jgi:hypothetical protein